MLSAVHVAFVWLVMRLIGDHAGLIQQIPYFPTAAEFGIN